MGWCVCVCVCAVVNVQGVSGPAGVGVADGGGRLPLGSSPACPALSETLQLLQPVAQPWRCGWVYTWDGYKLKTITTLLLLFLVAAVLRPWRQIVSPYAKLAEQTPLVPAVFADPLYWQMELFPGRGKTLVCDGSAFWRPARAATVTAGERMSLTPTPVLTQINLWPCTCPRPPPSPAPRTDRRGNGPPSRHGVAAGFIGSAGASVGGAERPVGGAHGGVLYGACVFFRDCEGHRPRFVCGLSGDNHRSPLRLSAREDKGTEGPAFGGDLLLDEDEAFKCSVTISRDFIHVTGMLELNCSDLAIALGFLQYGCLQLLQQFIIEERWPMYVAQSRFFFFFSC